MILGGRYALRRRLSLGGDIERWSASDATLQREVTLTIISSQYPYGAGVLDAARRAAGVEDARLVRILDVGTATDISFIVEEAISGSASLGTILLQGPLPAEEARRVAGEAAKGLEAAGVRGLHHLRLTPHHLLIAPDGSVRVGGVAVAAAIDGPDEHEPDPSTALRQDALSLVAIIYAALTGLWPLDPVPGVEPAPRASTGAVTPSEIVACVPGDLDTLCRLTLNEAAGPLTPGVVASRIAPWSREPVQRAGVAPTVVLRTPGPDKGTGEVPPIVPAAGGIPLPTTAPPASDLPPQTPSGAPTRPVSPAASTQAAVPALATGSVPQPGSVVPPVMPAAGGQEAAGGAATTVLGTALAGAGTAAGVVGDRLTSLAKAAGEKVPRPDPDRNVERMRVPVGLSKKDDVGLPLPLLPASTALPPTRGQSKIVLLIMAAFVAVALFFGYRGLVGPIGNVTLSKPTPKRTVIVSAPAVTVPASPAPKATATATGAGPIAIQSATGFDPQGDGRESNAWAKRAYDGDLATLWSTELYQSAQFGNIKKGVGLVLLLSQPTQVHQVTLDLGNGPVDLTAYVASSPSLTGATEIGSATAANGHLELKAAGAMPPSQYVIVWFTSVAQEGSQFHASIKEVALS